MSDPYTDLADRICKGIIVSGFENDADAEKVVMGQRDAIAGTLKRAGDKHPWKEVARKAGVCMTCALGAPEHFGCTDCLNTGWAGGSPEGFVPESHLAAATQRIETLESLRPHWAQGYSSDSIAAQTATAALSQMWKMLGAVDQTDAIEKLSALTKAAEGG